MAPFFSTFSNPVASGDSNFLQDVVGESVSNIDRLVPPIIKEVSSEAIWAVQKAPGVATEVQSAGVVSTASGFIKHISSEAISAAQGVATEVQHVGVVGESVTNIDRFVPPIIKQVSSEAISAAQKAPGVSAEVQRAGVLSTASGFIKQVSSEAISTAQGVATEVQHAGMVGESVTNIGRLVPPVIKQVSSEAISAAQKVPRVAVGVATEVPHAGVLSTASGFIKQVSSEAISAAQGVATEVQRAGVVGESVTKIDHLVPQVIKQVSSDAISAAQKVAGAAVDVATEVQHAGVVSTASGFIKQVSSEAILAAQGLATEVKRAGVVKEEVQRLKYLAFVQVAAVHVVLCFTNLYLYGKERLGPLKPVVEIVEGMVKSMVQLVFDKYFDVPFELLKFFDSKVDEFVTKIDRLVPPVIKQASSKAISAAQKALGVTVGLTPEVQSTGVVSTASGFIKQVSSGAISAAEGVATVVQPAGVIKEQLQRLKYLAFVQVTAGRAVLYFTKFYLYAKERSGPLKPVVEIIEGVVKSLFQMFFEGMLKSMVRMVFEYFDVPVELFNFVGKVGESVTKIDRLVPPVIKQVSSEAISAALKVPGVAVGLATDVQGAGVVSTASGFIKQVSSGAISAAQGVATEVQHAGVVGESVTKINRLIPPVIRQVSSEAISAAQKASGVATEVQHAGVASSASGFIKQVSSGAILAAQKAPGVALGVATEVQRAGVASTASGFIKQVSSEAISAAQKSPEVQHAGVVSTASALAKSVYTKYEPKVEQCAVSVWHKLNQLPLFPEVASVFVPTAAYFTDKYNQTVVSSAGKGYKVASYLPLVPIEKIAKVFS